MTLNVSSWPGNFQMAWKAFRWSGKLSDGLKVSMLPGMFPGGLGNVQMLSSFLDGMEEEAKLFR